MGISKEKIVQASIEILNRSGIGQLTTRELAKELNIKSASLYWHIKNMQDLYGLIAEQICSEIEVNCDLEDAKGYLSEMNIKYREKLLETKDAVEVMIRSRPVTLCRIEIIRNTLACLSKLGIERENLLTSANLLNNYVLSFVAEEIRVKTLSSEERENVNDIFGIRITNDFDKQFLYGLNVLFLGFGAE